MQQMFPRFTLKFFSPSKVFLDELGLTDDSNIFGTFSILRRIFRLIFGHRKPRANDYSGGHRYANFPKIICLLS